MKRPETGLTRWGWWVWLWFGRGGKGNCRYQEAVRNRGTVKRVYVLYALIKHTMVHAHVSE